MPTFVHYKLNKFSGINLTVKSVDRQSNFTFKNMQAKLYGKHREGVSW